MNRLVKSVTADAGINRCIWCHLMRHTAAMLMLRSGMPVTSVAAQLGDSVDTVVNFYLHSRTEDVKEDIKAFVI